MKAVMISIQPKWVELICSGKKTLEVRKKRPSIQAQFKCYVYETKSMHGRGKVIGEFICDDILTLGSQPSVEREMLIEEACLTEQELRFYKGKYAWHISDLKVYDDPKDLNKFYRTQKCDSCEIGYESSACIFDEECNVPVNMTRPPQSWCYVEE